MKGNPDVPWGFLFFVWWLIRSYQYKGIAAVVASLLTAGTAWLVFACIYWVTSRWQIVRRHPV